QLRDLWHLADPMLLQYWRFLTGAITGDFGLSLWQSQPALALVLQSLPATLLLTVCAMGLALVVALVLGALSALYPGRWIDRLSAAVTLIGQSMPNFW